jgi:hypothetical protein
MTYYRVALAMKFEAELSADNKMINLYEIWCGEKTTDTKKDSSNQNNNSSADEKRS